jgi:hypothetical protein
VVRADWRMSETDWQRLIGQLRRGDCAPFIGAGACSPPLPTGRELSKEIAAEFEYPFEDLEDLARVTQYAAVKHGDAVDLKRDVAERLRHRGTPDFSRETEPHAALARFPLSLYLTTNYDDFMIAALEQAGRSPRQNLCPWYGQEPPRRRRTPVREPEPTPDQPMVFHLHGSLHDARTLVLTEDDYLEFLVNLVRDQRSAFQQIIPDHVYFAITQRPLLFVGYRLHDWTFRVLFNGLLKPIARVQLRRHVSIQLAPPLLDGDEETEQRAMEYLTEFFHRWNISVYWGTADDFFDELIDRLGRSR